MLRFAQVILELLPMPVVGVTVEREVIFANAQAREFLEEPGRPLVGQPAPDLFEPELTGAIRRVRQRREEGGAPDHDAHVLPMVVDGDPVGTIVLTPERDPLDLELIDPRKAFRWSVRPV